MRSNIVITTPGGSQFPVTEAIEAGPLSWDTDWGSCPPPLIPSARVLTQPFWPEPHHREMKAWVVLVPPSRTRKPTSHWWIPGCAGLNSCDTRDHSIISVGLAESQVPSCFLALFVPLFGLVDRKCASLQWSSLALPVFISVQGPCSPEVTFWGDPRGRIFYCPRW